MVVAVGGTTQSAGMTTGQTGTSRGSRAGLEAQLDTYKKQLNDWVTCASAKTPEGKKMITDLTTKVSTTEARIQDLDNARGAKPNISDAYAATLTDVKTVEAATKSSSVGAGPGSVVDTFA